MNINVTMFAQAVVFAAFIWFTIRFIWPPLLAAIEARQKSIADGLAAADQGRQALEASTRQADVEMTHARAAGLVTQAEQRMSQMIDEAKNAAREESNREKAAAKAEIEQEVLRAKEALREQVAALAIAGAEKILRREINAQAHADLLNQLKQELK